jgi:hypothetical protein
LKQLYELVESARDVIAEKLVPNYRLEDVYRAIAYAFVRAALQGKSGRFELLEPLEKIIPKPLLAAVKRELFGRVHSIIKQVDYLLSEGSPVLVHGEAALERVIEEVKREVGRVDYVFVYDSMSVIEQVAVSAFLKAQDVRTLFLRTFFLNPLGLTRFMTSQLPGGERQTLRRVAQYVASNLGAQLYAKSSFIDVSVHESGLLGVDEFVKRIDISRIAAEVLKASERGVVLVFSDHGYDVVLSRRGDYLYVVHGFQEGSVDDIALLLLSRISAFMRVG